MYDVLLVRQQSREGGDGIWLVVSHKDTERRQSACAFDFLGRRVHSPRIAKRIRRVYRAKPSSFAGRCHEPRLLATEHLQPVAQATPGFSLASPRGFEPRLPP